MAFGLRSKSTRIPVQDALDGVAPPASETYLDAGSVLTGELRFAGSVRLDGRVEGQVHAGQAVIVGEHAEIDASIVADSLEVFGTVVGDIRVARQTVLHKSARVEGEIQTAGIVVEEGARFKGAILIGRDDPRPGAGMGIGQGPGAASASGSAAAATLAALDVPSLAAVRD
ncbi:MAG: polymer-forming cytoskeletal protein [Myxococcota bacterium]